MSTDEDEPAGDDALRGALREGVEAGRLRELLDERRAAGTPPGSDDAIAEAALARTERQVGGEPIAVPWHPRADFEAALREHPVFAEAWAHHDHPAYSLALDRRMREVAAAVGRAPVVVPVPLGELVAFAGPLGLEPDWAEARARFADEHRAGARAWPPGRNDACWCGEDAKYKRHCGR